MKQINVINITKYLENIYHLFNLIKKPHFG